MRGLRSLGWVALGCGFMLAPAAVMAAAPSGSQGQASQDQQQAYPDQMAACPMMGAADATRQAVSEGAQVRVESTPDGAIVRFAAPSGNQQAVQDSRTAAQQLADAAQAGCACQGMQGQQPGMQRRGQQGQQPSGGMPGSSMEQGGGM